MGLWLVKKDNFKKTTYALILMGSIPDRVLEAIDLYHESRIDTILIVKTHQMSIQSLNSKGVTLPGNAELSRYALTELGVPESRIIIIPGLARSTIDEAHSLKIYVDNKPWIDKIALITSAQHTFRAGLIFEKVLSDRKDAITVLSHPSSYTDFNAEKWWTDKESTETLIIEYGKLFYGLINEY